MITDDRELATTQSPLAISEPPGSISPARQHVLLQAGVDLSSTHVPPLRAPDRDCDDGNDACDNGNDNRGNVHRAILIHVR
jgi:hypothetical protein